VLARWPIQNKLLFGVALLLAIVIGLSFTGFRGVYAYRELARGISHRANEMPLAADLTRRVGDLRMTFSNVQLLKSKPDVFAYPNDTAFSQAFNDQEIRGLQQAFRTSLTGVTESLRSYRAQLENGEFDDAFFSDNRAELETVAKMERSVARLHKAESNNNWMTEPILVNAYKDELEELDRLSNELPSFLQRRMHNLAGDVRSQYRTWITLTWSTAGAATLLLGAAVFCGYSWIFRPLSDLVRGSRRVASGDFSYRISLPTQDEMAELAAAMNGMTERFQQIRDDLDHQVQQRTKEVVRSEQLASVGFLAAGVAHEINNPLAAIAMCAESLEMRMHEIIVADDQQPDGEHNEEVTILRKYLRRIQDEAFRCKGITEKLLDFSRLGDVQKQNTDLVELTEGVIEMVRHLGKYREKKIEFRASQPVIAAVNAQEMKQVVLNLITNGLDSLDPQGTVTVELSRRGSQAELLVSDNGCGMTPEVLKHLFEPFFTRRRDGQGTGLGLSITYRIVQDHGGAIAVASAGPGCGSQFRVSLPLVQSQHHETRQAA
jgi:signal transduction histidine kinase